MTEKDPHKELRKNIHAQIDKIRIRKGTKKQMHRDVEESTTLEQLSQMQTAAIGLANLDPAALARELAKEMSAPSHLGKHTPETLTQELFSLRNTKPAFRKEEWFDKLEKITRLIREIKDPRVKQGLENRVKAMMSGEG